MKDFITNKFILGIRRGSWLKKIGSFVKKLKDSIKEKKQGHAVVIPAQAGIQDDDNVLKRLDSCFRRNDALFLINCHI